MSITDSNPKFEPLDKCISEILNGTTETQNDAGEGFPVSRIETVQKAKFDESRIRFIKNPSPNLLEKYKYQVGDIAFSHINSFEHIGKTAIYEGHPKNLIHGMNLLRFRPNTELVLPRYLFLYFQSEEFRSIVRSDVSHAVNQCSTNQKKLKNIPIPLFSLKRQGAIVKKIDSLFSEIESATEELQKTKQRLELYKQSVLNAAIRGKLVPQDPNDEPASKLLERIRVEKEKLIKEKKLKKEKPLLPIDPSEVPFELSKGWEWVRLGDIWYRLLSGFAFKSETYVSSSEYQLIRLGNVKPDRLLLDEKQVFLPNVVAKDAAEFEIAVGDILVTMTGTKGKRDYVYTCEVKSIPKEKKLLLNQRVGAIRLSKFVNTSFFNLVLKDEAVLSTIFRLATGSVNQANIGVDALRNAVIPLPPKEQQDKITEIILKANEMIFENAKSLKEYEASSSLLKQSILKSAFEGKLI